jgi:hypothetical protein
MIRSVFASIVASGVLAASATNALATFSVTFNGVSPSKSLSVSSDYGSSYHYLTAGKFNFTGNASNPPGLQTGFSGFCIELTQSVSTGHTYSDYTVTALASAPVPGTAMGAAKADRIAELWGRQYDGLSTADDYAAFQLAIWEIVNDNSLSLTSGKLRAAPSTVRTLASQWLAKIDGTGPKTQGLYAITSANHQDFIVPAPGAGVLAIGGFLFGISRRRR